jgi:hypothetical protein
MWAVGLFAATALAQDSRRPLSDQELDRVTAGQEQLAAGNQINANASAVVVRDSSATLVDAAIVENSTTGPANGSGLNLISAAESIVANGLNVSDGSDNARPAATQIRTNQLNEVIQSSEPTSSLQQIAGGAYIKDIHQIVGQMTSASSTYKHDVSTSFSSSFHFENITQDVDVPGFNPFNSVIHLPKLGIPALTVPAFSFGFDLTTGSEPFKFGVSANVSVGPINVDFGGINLGDLDLTKDDLILKNPTLDLPSVSGQISGQGEVCVFKCAGGGGSATFHLDPNAVLSAIGFHGFPDIDLGPNPFKGLKIQAGGGVAGVGTGTLNASAGSIGANVNFGLKWPDNLQSIDFKIPGFSIPLGSLGTINVPGHDFGTVNLNIPSVSFSFPIIPNISLGGFSLSSHNAAYCISYMGGCPLVSATFTDSSSNSSHEEHSSGSASISSNDQSTTYEHDVLFPPTVTGMEGQYLVLADSSLSSQSESSLRMSGTAQQGFHALNLLNLTSTLMATGVNVSMTPTAGLGVSLSQANNVFQTH